MVATKHWLCIPPVFLLISFSAKAQQCSNCKTTPSVAQYDLDVQIPKPELKGEKTVGWLEWLELFSMAGKATAYLSANGRGCLLFTQPLSTEASNESFISGDGIEIPPLNEESAILIIGATYTNLPPPGDVSRFGKYLITGSVTQQGSDYMMHLELQTSCSRKTVASASVPFQASASGEYIRGIAHQAAAQLSPLSEKIKQFELKERNESDIVSLDDDNAESISIKPKKYHLAPGEQTELEISFKDCDGMPLPNRKIAFTKGSLNGESVSAGTVGGTVTPTTVTTDANGKAKATFKMGSEKTAIIDAYHIYQKPYGCEGIKSGSAAIGAVPVKVQISYSQNETRTLQRGTLPSIKIQGGEEREQTVMLHTAVLYHFPSAKSLKDGFLISVAKDNPEPGTKTQHITESGYFDSKKRVETAFITVAVGNVQMVQAVEKGSQTNSFGYASLDHPSQLYFFRGDANTPASFFWSVEYPASNDEIAGGAISIVKGEDGVSWKVNPIKDPNSPYKTEYLLSLKLDAAEELKKGEKAMKDAFGFNLDQLMTKVDPTDPKQNMAGAKGTQTISVRILSPYVD